MFCFFDWPLSYLLLGAGLITHRKRYLSFVCSYFVTLRAGDEQELFVLDVDSLQILTHLQSCLCPTLDP